MGEFDPKVDDAFREYANLQLRRHYLLSCVNDDSFDPAAIEERMEQLWSEFDDATRQSLSGMASDLNWIRRNCELPPKGRKTPEEVAAAELTELKTAMKLKDWHRILHFLRLCAPSYRPSSIARERGIAYAAIGLPNYARIFSAQAIEFSAIKVAGGAEVGSEIVPRMYATVPREQAIESNGIKIQFAAVAKSSALAGNWLSVG